MWGVWPWKDFSMGYVSGGDLARAPGGVGFRFTFIKGGVFPGLSLCKAFQAFSTVLLCILLLGGKRLETVANVLWFV